MDDSKVQFIGNPCGHHGPYTFYKAFKFNRDDKCRILTLGEFFFVKIFSEAPVCISELQLLWEDKNNSQLLSSVRLYYLPEHTPDGPQEHHGQDEVLAVSEKIILRVEDLVELIRDGVSWDRGSVPFTDTSYNHQQSRNLAKSFAANNFGLHFKGERKNENTGCEESSSTQVTILSFPRYCRYRAVLKRLEKCEDKWLHDALVCAIGGFTVKNANSRVVFCRDTFDAPDLDTLDIRCDHLAPNLKGRPRKKRARSKKDSQDSDSCESNGDLFLPSGGSQSKPSPVTAGRTRKDSQKNGSLLPDRKDITQEEQAFLHSLHKYMKSRKTPIERIPSLGFKQIDIYVFYTFAQKLGGYDQITQKRLWKHLYDQLGGNPGSTSAATCTRRHYEKLLLPYERYKNGEEHVPLESVASDSDKSENQDDLAPICDGKSPEEGEPTPIRDKVNTEGTKRGNSPSSDSQESKLCSKDSPRPVLTEQSVNQKVEVVSGSKADRCNVVLSADKFAESRPKLLEMKNRNKISILSPITAHKPLSHPSSPYHSPYVPHHYQKSSALQTVSKPHSAHTPFLTPARSLPVSASSAVSIKSGSKDEAYIKHLNSLSQHSRSGEVLRTAHQKDSTSIHRPSVIQHTPKIKPAHQNSAHDKPAVTLEPRKAASHTAHLNPPRQALPAHSNHLKRNYPAYLENTGLGHPVHRVPPYEYSSGRSRQVSQPLVSSLKRPRLQDPSSPHYYLAQMRSLAGDFNKKQPGVTANRPRLPKPSHQPPPPPKYTHTDEQPTDLSVKKTPEIKASVGIDLSKKRNTTPKRECSPQHYRSSPSETYRQPVSHRPAHNSPSPVPAHIKSTHPSCSQLSPSPYKSQRSDTDRRTPGPYATTPELAKAAKTFPMESSHLLHPAFPHTYMSPTMVPRGIVNFSPHSVHNMFEAHMRANVAQAAAYEELVKRNMSRVQGAASPSSSTVPGQTKYSGSTTRQPYPH